MKYEYTSVKLTIDSQQLQAMSMGVSPQETIDAIMEMVAGTMNEYGKKGWRVMQPLVLPILWLEREVQPRRRSPSPYTPKKTPSKKASVK